MHQKHRQPLIILAGPSGVGKSTFLARALQDFPALFDTVTYTTRSMRQGESEGNPYHFVDRPKFQQLVQEGFFVEWAEVHGNLYGTPLYQLEEAWARGQVVIMDVDVQGARTFREKFPWSLSVFILPPSIDELRRRVTRRESGAPRDLELRMQNAEREMREAPQFSYQLVNDEFDRCYTELKKIIAAAMNPS